MRSFGNLFEKTPMNWGLRGDPYLWEEMKKYFIETPMPSSQQEISDHIFRAFEKITGHSILETQNFYVERYAQRSGISSGMIDLSYWRETAIPYLWYLTENDDILEFFKNRKRQKPNK
jgi:hypothetical protein